MNEQAHDAEKVAETIAQLAAAEKREAIAAFLGMRLESLTPGFARVVMPVQPEYLNFHGTVFGGIIMSVADQAFAYAANSLSYPSVAAQFNLHFLSSVGEGDELVAECRVLRSGRRVGVSEITVTSKAGKLVAKATATTIPVEAREEQP
ncbi:MAG: PaaI family thioesterase [Chloroflexota bacterium]